MHSKGIFQRIVIVFLLLIVPVFIISNYSIIKSKRDLSTEFFSEILSSDEYLTDKSFVFILFANSCDKLCDQNISSILGQNYDNYRIIFLQGDGIEEAVQQMRQLAAKANKSHLLTVIQAPEGKVSIDTFRAAIQQCQNDDIVIQLECSDWLAHENVLKTLNETYSSSKDVWLTYAQFLEYPSYRKGRNQAYLKKMLRDRYSKKIPWLSSHFKTYYAGLFKQIEPDSKFTYKRSLVAENLDLFMLPMVESSRNHIRFIDEVLFIHNLANDKDPISYQPLGNKPSP